LHERVRKNLWGYADHESFGAADLHKLKYQVSVGSYQHTDKAVQEAKSEKNAATGYTIFMYIVIC